jgi:hypothetical protein
MLLRAAFLVTLLTFSASGQLPNTYAELKSALGLTDFQIDHLQRVKASAHPAPQRPQTAGQIYLPIPASRTANQWRQLQQEKDAGRDLALAVLTPEQREILATTARVLGKRGRAARLIQIGAITCGQWPEGCGCLCGGIDADTTFELDDAQRALLEEVRAPVRQARSDLKRRIANGEGTVGVAELRKEYDALKVPREAVIAIFSDDQRASFSAFDNDLRVVKQAIEIGLLSAPAPMGECLCN